ncbi:MAG TPA: DUF488 domain-containing protein [Candidatus Binatia bacterium]|jgi:uncharacterized protein (DUF488 family)|nr:DUF488 domain-containing protein [Candidatus Binatia bacterium]
MSFDERRAIYTIGHSTRTIEAFIELLNVHAIEMLIDVRRWPGSRRHPQFSREALSASLKAEGIEYLWRGDLGGFRKPAPDSVNTAWKVATFRAYADFMLTQEFATIMDEMEAIASNRQVALMCAEAVPWRCHRQLLADAFVVRGWSIRHIMDKGSHEHELPSFARAEGTRIYYSRQ